MLLCHSFVADRSHLLTDCHVRRANGTVSKVYIRPMGKGLPAFGGLYTNKKKLRKRGYFMRIVRSVAVGVSLISMIGLSACGGGRGSFGSVGVGGGAATQQAGDQGRGVRHTPQADEPRETIWDLFKNVDDPNTTVEVNRYLWNASLDVLSFMPVKAADPFSGIIAFDYGRPPGGGTAYKATVYVRDPALDARSLSVALYSRSGPASAEAARKVEDAILTRARQLRIRDGDL